MNTWISVGIYVIFLIGMYYVLVHLPRKMQDKRHREMLQSLTAGDKVLTVGGLYGLVARQDEDKIWLTVAEGVEMEFSIRAISGKVETKKAEE